MVLRLWKDAERAELRALAIDPPRRKGSGNSSSHSPQRDGRCRLGPANSRWFSRGYQVIIARRRVVR